MPDGRSGSEGLSAADHADVQRQADRYMARRSLAGSLTYPVLCLVVGMGNPLFADFPALSRVLSVLLVVAIIRSFSSANEFAGKIHTTNARQISTTNNLLIFLSFLC